ncbi:BLUF domain-containing protein [uncultured Hymenobacter sp.]|uniref:BLUF domain-containing protein n=1 Tax=uncultured Hymenobacter sp. TaxID=170016 RepID=UPI0035C982AB
MIANNYLSPTGLPLHHLVYSSSAPVELSAATLAELLRGSRQRNEQRDITGILLYQQLQFLQVLEGPEAAVRAIYRRIARDQRHYSLTVLSDGPIARRLFADWSMGFAAPVAASFSFSSVTGYLDPAHLPPPTPTTPDAGLLGLIYEFIQTTEVFF